MGSTDGIAKHYQGRLRVVISTLLVAALMAAAFLSLEGTFAGAAIAQDSGGGLVFNTPTPSADEEDNADENDPDLEEVEDEDDSSGGINQPGDEEEEQEIAEEVSFGAGDWIGGY